MELLAVLLFYFFVERGCLSFLLVLQELVPFIKINWDL